MRTKIVALAAAGAVGLGGLALAGPALAATSTSGSSGSSGSSSSSAPAARVDKIKEALASLVSDGTLTQAQADKVASKLADAKLGHQGRFGPGGPGGRHGFADLSAAAKALGMTEADLKTALVSGKSLATIASEKGVSVDTLVSALVDAAKTHLAEEVSAGRLTQAEADARIAELKTRITERVNATPPAKGSFRVPGDKAERKPTTSPSPSTTS